MDAQELMQSAPGTREAAPELDNLLTAAKTTLDGARGKRDAAAAHKAALLVKQGKLTAQLVSLTSALTAEQPGASAAVLAAIDAGREQGALITALRKCNAKRAELMEAHAAVAITLDHVTLRLIPEADVDVVQGNIAFSQAAKDYLYAESQVKLNAMKIATEPLRALDPGVEIAMGSTSVVAKYVEAISGRLLDIAAQEKDLDARRAFARTARSAKSVRELVAPGGN